MAPPSSFCETSFENKKTNFIFEYGNFKSSKDKTKLLDGKEAEFYQISDINDLKIRPLVTTQRLTCYLKMFI